MLCHVTLCAAPTRSGPQGCQPVLTGTQSLFKLYQTWRVTGTALPWDTVTAWQPRQQCWHCQWHTILSHCDSKSDASVQQSDCTVTVTSDPPLAPVIGTMRPQLFVRMTLLNFKGCKISPTQSQDFTSLEAAMESFTNQISKCGGTRQCKTSKQLEEHGLQNCSDKKIKMDGNKIPRLCYQTKDNYYNSAEFMKRVVTLATQAGRSFKDDEPAGDANMKKTLTALKTTFRASEHR
eukprot:1152050-Rhodomonas_salina.1